jgi:hypothetical protein
LLLLIFSPRETADFFMLLRLPGDGYSLLCSKKKPPRHTLTFFEAAFFFFFFFFFFKGLVAGCHSFLFYFSYFITYIHSFIQSRSYNTFNHRHLLRPLSISSSLVCSVGKHLPVVPSRESNSGLPYSKPTGYQLSHAAPSRF